jgi:predicted DNA-binding transcriptional regulator AlpA
MTSINMDDLWDIDRAARFLGVPPTTLYQWRYRGRGPKGHKVGRHVRYFPVDVIAWVRDQA